jgi:hypothetical protein
MLAIHSPFNPKIDQNYNKRYSQFRFTYAGICPSRYIHIGNKTRVRLDWLQTLAVHREIVLESSPRFRRFFCCYFGSYVR